MQYNSYPLHKLFTQWVSDNEREKAGRGTHCNNCTSFAGEMPSKFRYTYVKNLEKKIARKLILRYECITCISCSPL